MPKTIHVISPVAGFGNSLDLELVSTLLEENGFHVTRYPVRQRGKKARLGRVVKRVLGFRGRFDVNIFLAPIFPEWIPMARKNILIPNAEGFAGHLRKWLPKMDMVLAKTRSTERIFTKLGCRTEFTSFTSPDNFDEQVARNPTNFFHACSSQFKGTKRLLEVWKNHPEWPELVTAINHNDTIPEAYFDAPNIQAFRKRLPASEIKNLQNSSHFHLCCSEAEGFGHYIMESMSCKAVTFTTNAAPMNELVQASRGILVDHLEETPVMNLSHRYLFKPESLEEMVESARKLDPVTIEQIGANARAFFFANDQFFRKRFLEVIRSL
jgi:hypothetical protein